MRRHVLQVLSIGLVMAIGCGKPAQPNSKPVEVGDPVTKPTPGPTVGEGRKYSPPEKDYAVSLPSGANTPREQQFGELRQLMLRWTDETALMVTVRPYESELIEKFTPTQLLEKASEDLADTLSKRPGSNKATNRSGHVAREIEFEDSKNSHIRTLLCIANGNLYQVTATGPKDVVTSRSRSAGQTSA